MTKSVGSKSIDLLFSIICGPFLLVATGESRFILKVGVPIWSYALRSKKEGYEVYVKELEALISGQRVIMLDPIR